MKIAMMARNPKLYSHQRLVEAAKAAGHEIDIINTTQVYVNITSHNPELRYKGTKLEGYDAVIPRIGASITFYGLAVLRQFEMMGVWPLNESVAIGRSRDKLRALQLLARKGIGLPVTAFAHSDDFADDVIAIAGGAPVVIKLLEGTQGIGVVLGETHNSAKSVIEAFRGVKVNIMVQEFIKEAGGSDIRCLVIGDRVIAAMKKAHPYEEVAYDVYPLRLPESGGIGCLGSVRSCGVRELAGRLGEKLRAEARISGKPPARIRRAAVVPGRNRSFFFLACASAGITVLKPSPV